MKPLGASAWDRTKIFRIMKQWQFWVLLVGYFLVQGSYPIQQPAFALWLKLTGHSVYQINVWPTGQYAVGVVTQLLAGVISDSPIFRGKRWQTLIAMQVPTIFGCIVLAFIAAGVPGIYLVYS
jgi:MFS family permease